MSPSTVTTAPGDVTLAVPGGGRDILVLQRLIHQKLGVGVAAVDGDIGRKGPGTNGLKPPLDECLCYPCILKCHCPDYGY